MPKGIVSMMMLRFFDAVYLLVYSRIWLFTDTHFVSQVTLLFLICNFPSSIITTIAAILHAFVKYKLYLLLL